MWALPWVPRGWAACNGALLSIPNNTALFSLLGTNFGGDGTTNFALPNLNGRVPVYAGDGVGNIGSMGGTEQVTVTVETLPGHTHQWMASTADAEFPGADGHVLAKGTTPLYGSPTTSLVQMADDSLRPAGGGQPHNNIQPVLAVNFCIAITGLYPSRD